MYGAFEHVCQSLTLFSVAELVDGLAWPFPKLDDTCSDDYDHIADIKSSGQRLSTSRWGDEGEQYLAATSSPAPALGVRNPSTALLPCNSCAAAAKFPVRTQSKKTSAHLQGHPFSSTSFTPSQSGPVPPRRSASAEDTTPTSEAKDELQRAEAQYRLAKDKVVLALKCQTAATRQHTPKPRPSRVPHSIIERRYRHNLKTKLDVLSAKLPNLENFCNSALDIEDSNRSLKTQSKAAVIAAAVKYIDELETKAAQRKEHTSALQEQIQGLQNLVRCDDCAIMRYVQSLQLPSSDPEAVPDVQSF